MIDLHNRKETSNFENFAKENTSRNADEEYISDSKEESIN